MKDLGIGDLVTLKSNAKRYRGGRARVSDLKTHRGVEGYIVERLEDIGDGKRVIFVTRGEME